jgi:hypothetical protein
MTSRTCSILIEPISPGSMTMTSGCTPRWMRRQAGHSPHASRANSAAPLSVRPEPDTYILLRLEAVHRFGNRHRSSALADARGSGQQQRRRQRITGDRAGQQRQQTTMADDGTERHEDNFKCQDGRVTMPESMPIEGPAKAGHYIGPRIAAWVLGALTAVALAGSVYRVPIQVSDSLEVIERVIPMPSAAAAFVDGLHNSPTMLRPLKRSARGSWCRRARRSAAATISSFAATTHWPASF